MNATAQSNPITETESLYIVVSRKGSGHTVGTIETLKKLATNSGHELTYHPSRRFKDVVVIRMNGYAVSMGFRSRVASFEYFNELND